MRTSHTPHALDNFPVYSSSFISEDELILGGGGGASRAGIKNKLRLYKVGPDRNIELLDDFEMEQGEDAPMSIAAHNKTGTIVCGVNSAAEKLRMNQNQNCRVFTVKNHKFDLLNTRGTLSIKDDSLDYQKVTVLSPDGGFLAVAGAHNFSLLSYPSLVPVCEPLTLEEEIYDATFSSTMLVIATTHSLLVYALPILPKLPQTPSSAKTKVKGKSKKAKTMEPMGTERLSLLNVVEAPAVTGADGTFRSAKFHPLDDNVLFSTLNVSFPRKPKSKITPRQAFVHKWNTKTWGVEKVRKVSDKGLTCFAISPDGKSMGLGTSELTISLLEANTLSPLVTILKAHGISPTTMSFNWSSSTLVSASADMVRIITVPKSVAGSSSWVSILLTTLFILLLAILAQKYLSANGVY